MESDKPSKGRSPANGEHPIEKPEGAETEIVIGDERFESLGSLWEYCHQQKTQSTDRWTPPSSLKPESDGSHLRLTLGSDRKSVV